MFSNRHFLKIHQTSKLIVANEVANEIEDHVKQRNVWSRYTASGSCIDIRHRALRKLVLSFSLISLDFCSINYLKQHQGCWLFCLMTYILINTNSVPKINWPPVGPTRLLGENMCENMFGSPFKASNGEVLSPWQYFFPIDFLLRPNLGRPKCEQPRPWEWGHTQNPRVKKTTKKQPNIISGIILVERWHRQNKWS